MTTPNTNMTYLVEGQNQAEVTVNDAFNIIDGLLGHSIVDRDLTAPPGSPANGAVYIPLATATGDWTGEENNLALYYDGWIFVTPPEGFEAYVADEDVVVRFNGSTWDVVEDRITIAIETQGSTGGASTLTFTRRGKAEAFFVRVRVCDNAGYADATNATIAAGTNTTVVETVTATKDLIFKSHTDGVVRVDITDGTAETVTVRMGPAPLTPLECSYESTQQLTHA